MIYKVLLVKDVKQSNSVVHVYIYAHTHRDIYIYIYSGFFQLYVIIRYWALFSMLHGRTLLLVIVGYVGYLLYKCVYIYSIFVYYI